MNPGLVVKLRPTGPWRIGPDSGARNRVDAIYHSDSLYAAVTSMIARLGSLAEWLDATARQNAPAVCFSSCFPFLDEIGFVIPPRTVWPPTSPGLMSARVRWKSARFVPLGIVQAILAGQRLDPNHWSVDGASECLVPVGRPGPFRTGIRWNAAVDRLTGATERHSMACIEFRPGAGLWTIVSFADDAARQHWLDPVKAAFRLLADSGFGGERSRGWGRSEAPEFVEGTLPDMIVPPKSATVDQGFSVGEPAEVESAPVSTTPPEATEPEAREPETAEPETATAEVRAPADIQPLATPAADLPPDPEKEPPAEEPPLSTPPEPRHGEPVPPTPEPEGSASTKPPSTPAPEVVPSEAPPAEKQPEPVSTPAPEAAAAETAPPDAVASEAPPPPEKQAGTPSTPSPEIAAADTAPPDAEASEALPPPEKQAETPSTPSPEVAAAETAPPDAVASEAPPPPEKQAGTPSTPSPEIAAAGTAPPDAAAPEALPPAEKQPEPVSPPAPEIAAVDTAALPSPPVVELPPEPEPETVPPSIGATSSFWVLSLYTPGPEDAIDWQKGNYTVTVRGGRVEGSGELKKKMQMVAEGSVLAAAGEPRGSATDVAPDGCAHPVFRAGFAVCIPLPEVG